MHSEHWNDIQVLPTDVENEFKLLGTNTDEDRVDVEIGTCRQLPGKEKETSYSTYFELGLDSYRKLFACDGVQEWAMLDLGSVIWGCGIVWKSVFVTVTGR
jgi:hypothetical protein